MDRPAIDRDGTGRQHPAAGLRPDLRHRAVQIHHFVLGLHDARVLLRRLSWIRKRPGKRRQRNRQHGQQDHSQQTVPNPVQCKTPSSVVSYRPFRSPAGNIFGLGRKMAGRNMGIVHKSLPSPRGEPREPPDKDRLMTTMPEVVSGRMVFSFNFKGFMGRKVAFP
jgi:hypothetical protein